MINKYFDGQIPAYVEGVTDFDIELAQVAEQSIANYHTYMEAVDYPRALEAVWTLSLVLINTSTRQLHGSWQKMKHSAINWQVS